MTGAAMPNLLFKSWSRKSRMSDRPCCVRAAETSLRGRWVEASDTGSGGAAGPAWPSSPITRRGCPASIITTCVLPVRSAKYSVWPEKATPASLMVLFCSGAVTTASKWPACTPAMAASSVASTARPFSLFSTPGTTWAVSGTSITHSRSVPKRGRPPLRSACKDSAAMWMAGSMSAASMDRKAASPSSTQFTRWRSAQAARMAISGPMPAGSPTVTASARRAGGVPAGLDGDALTDGLSSLLQIVGAVFAVSLVAHLALPGVGLFLDLAVADGVAGGVALAFLGGVVALALEHFDQVVAEAGLDRLADLARLERVHGRLELGHGVARIQPAQVAALGGRAVGAVLARQVFEGGGLVVEALLELDQLALGVVGAHGRRDLDQDVARVGLLHGGGGLRLGDAALVDQFQDVEGADALHDRRDLARLEFIERLGKHRRQAVRIAPADLAALERVGRVGIRAGHLGEVGAGAQLAHDFLGAGAARGDHVGVGVVGDAYHDLRQVVLELLGGGGLLRRQVAVDLGAGDLDLGVDLMLAQALHDDFLADFLAEGGVRRALLLGGVALLMDGHLLLLGDAADGAVEHAVVDPHAHLLGFLQLGALDDHALEDLALQIGGLGNRHVLGLHAAGHGLDAGGQFLAGDDVVVDDHGDRVDRHVGRGGGRRGEQRLAGRRGVGAGGRLAVGGRRGRGLLAEHAATGGGDAQQQCGDVQVVHTGITHR